MRARAEIHEPALSASLRRGRACGVSVEWAAQVRACLAEEVAPKAAPPEAAASLTTEEAKVTYLPPHPHPPPPHLPHPTPPEDFLPGCHRLLPERHARMLRRRGSFIWCWGLQVHPGQWHAMPWLPRASAEGIMSSARLHTR